MPVISLLTIIIVLILVIFYYLSRIEVYKRERFELLHTMHDIRYQILTETFTINVLLMKCWQSHYQRVDKLNKEIRELKSFKR